MVSVLRDETPRCRWQPSCAGERSDRQDLVSAADLDLVLWKCGKIEPRAQHGLLGNHELTRKVPGQGFESARGIDGVTDRSYRGGIAIAHLSDNGRSAMNTDADTQWPIEFGLQRSGQFVESRRLEPGSGECVPATAWAPRSIPNKAMTPSPMNLSTRPPAASTACPIVAK